MMNTSKNGKGKTAAGAVMFAMTLAMLLSCAGVLSAEDSKDTKKKDKKQFVTLADVENPKIKYKNILDGLDLSKFVWPNPPAVTRIRYINFWSGERLEVAQQNQQKKKNSWM